MKNNATDIPDTANELANEEKRFESELRIGKKVFFSSAGILLFLMLAAGLLTYIIPSGTFAREFIDGREVVIPDSFEFTDRPDYPVWRWLMAPIEVLGSDDAFMIFAIIIFIIIVGGSFSTMERAGVLKAAINRTVERSGAHPYRLMAIIVFFFMSLGAFMGIFEEVIPLVPIIVALAYRLGWDSLTGLGMSLLATAFGFSAAVANPFTVGVAQQLIGLPMFSGSFFRLIIFVIIYCLLVAFLYRHIRIIEKDPHRSPVYHEDAMVKAKYTDIAHTENPLEQQKMSRAIRFFLIVLCFLIILLISSAFIDVVSDFSFPLIGLLFLTSGVGSSLIAGIGLKQLIITFSSGIARFSPGIILILMAVSVRYIITEGGIMDSILYFASVYIAESNPYQAVLMIYALVLALNFFIASGSAKAFLVMPIIAPLADLTEVTRQTAVLAFIFGDGFSNVLYPSNPGLLIVLGLTVVSYVKWFRWIIGLQMMVLIITCAMLFLAVKINLGPF